MADVANQSSETVDTADETCLKGLRPSARLYRGDSGDVGQGGSFRGFWRIYTLCLFQSLPMSGRHTSRLTAWKKKCGLRISSTSRSQISTTLRFRVTSRVRLSYEGCRTCDEDRCLPPPKKKGQPHPKVSLSFYRPYCFPYPEGNSHVVCGCGRL